MINYDHHSPSSLNLFAACPSMWVVEKILGQKQIVGVPAHRGVAVEAGVAHGLADLKAPLKDCVAIANARYDTLTAMSGDERRERYKRDMPDMIEMALNELRPYGEPSEMQGFISRQLDGLNLPMIGYFRFQAGTMMVSCRPQNHRADAERNQDCARAASIVLCFRQYGQAA